MNIYDILDRLDMYQTKAIMDQSKFCLVHAGDKEKENICFILCAKMLYLHTLQGMSYNNILLISKSLESQNKICKLFCELSSDNEQPEFINIEMLKDNNYNFCWQSHFKIILFEDAIRINENRILFFLKKIFRSDTQIFAVTYNKAEKCILTETLLLKDSDVNHVFLYKKGKEMVASSIKCNNKQVISNEPVEKRGMVEKKGNNYCTHNLEKRLEPTGTLQKFRLEYGKDHFSNEQMWIKKINQSRQKVNHPKYGIGVVLSETEHTFLVEFEGYGERKLLKVLTARY